jgi:hypothetical protein
MLRIQRREKGEVVFTLSGRMDAENIAELKVLLGAEALRNGWHQARQLSGIRPRMDYERTTSELAKPVPTTKGVSRNQL